jgi:competence protein ComEA
MFSPRIRGVLVLAAGVACLLAAWGLVGLFAGKWHGGAPTTEAGSALPFLSARESSEKKIGSGSDNAGIAAPSPVRPSQPVPEEWFVYVTGAVVRPGVYALPAGARAYVALERAGGFSGEADTEAVNLAAPLADGVHFHVPRKGEPPRGGTSDSSGGDPSTGVSSSSAASRVAPAGTGGSTAKINLNTATEADLEKLPGVGPKTAAAIVADREARGPFGRIEDLQRVRGIGAKKFDALKDLVTVGP